MPPIAQKMSAMPTLFVPLMIVAGRMKIPDPDEASLLSRCLNQSHTAQHTLFLTYRSIENQTYHRQGSQAVLIRGAFDDELVRVLLSFLQLGNIVFVEEHRERLGGSFFGYCLQRSGSQPGSRDSILKVPSVPV